MVSGEQKANPLGKADNPLLLSRDEVNQLADEIAEASAYIDAATHRLLTGPVASMKPKVGARKVRCRAPTG